MKKWKFWLPAGALILVAILMSFGCTTLETTAGGAVVGAIPGAIIGHQSGHAGEGAAIGAGIGGLLGYIYGSEQEKQAAMARVDAAESRAAQAAVVRREVQVRSADGKSFTTVTLQQEPNGWVVVNPGTGEVFDNIPSPEDLRVRGYGPGGPPR